MRCAVHPSPTEPARARAQTGAQERTRRRLRRALRRLVALLQRGSCGDGKCDQHRSARTTLLRRTAGGSARGLPLAEWAEVALEVEGRRLSLSEQLANPAPPSAEFRMLHDACVQAACCASQAAAATAGSARFMRRALDGADVPSGSPVERRSNVSVNERPLRRHSDLIAYVALPRGPTPGPRLPPAWAEQARLTSAGSPGLSSSRRCPSAGGASRPAEAATWARARPRGRSVCTNGWLHGLVHVGERGYGREGQGRAG